MRIGRIFRQCVRSRSAQGWYDAIDDQLSDELWSALRRHVHMSAYRDAVLNCTQRLETHLLSHSHGANA